MDSKSALPSLISTLSQFERGRGVFDKSLSLELKKSSTQVIRKDAQKSASEDDDSLPTFEFGYSERDGVNSFAEYTELVKSQGLEEYSQASSAPGSTRNMSTVAAQQIMPDHIRQFKEEWDQVTQNRIKLPIIRQLSPRTRKKISLLPPPNAIDLQKLQSFETLTAQRPPPHLLYTELKDRATRQEMSRMRKGIFTMQDVSAKHAPPSRLSDKRAKYVHELDSDMSVSFASASFFNDVRDRQMRKKQEGNRAKLVAGDLDEEENTSMPPLRPGSPKLSAYPFQTGLTSLLSRSASPFCTEPTGRRRQSGSEYSLLNDGGGDQEEGGAEPSWKSATSKQSGVIGGSDTKSEVTRGRAVSVSAVGVGKATHKGKHRANECSVSTNKGPVLSTTQSVGVLNSIHVPHDHSFLQSTYEPMLQQTTDVANAALTTYDTIAQQFDRNQQQNYRRRKHHDTFMGNWKTSLLEEIGLDIDPAHNTRVKYGKAITLVMYYLIIVKFKHAIERWKQFVTKVNKFRRDRAARLLGRVCRGMLARQMVTEMRINRQRQLEAEQEFERQRRAFQNFMSRRIAVAWRRHRKWQSKKLRRLRYVAARTIQKRARGNRGRAYARWFRMYKERCLASCILIQSVWRMYKAKRRVTLLRKLEYVRQWELSRAEKLMLQRMEYRHHGASLTLCRAYRAHTIHVRLREILYWNRFQLALRIQSVYRGYVVRKVYYRLALAKAKKELARNNAATLIQSHVRRYHARRAFFVMTEGKRQRDERRKRRKKKKLRDLVRDLWNSFEYNIQMISCVFCNVL